MPPKKTTDGFVKDSKAKYKEQFDYSAVDYKNNKTPVKLRCIKHNHWFFQRPDAHLFGSKNGGCEHCAAESKSEMRRIPKEEFETRSKNHPNHKNKNYDYSKVEYVYSEQRKCYILSENTNTYITIICKEPLYDVDYNIIGVHGEFQQIPNDHMGGHGCSECGGVKKLIPEIFFLRVSKIHKGKYNYDKTIYQGLTIPIDIGCPIGDHGYFSQTPHNHMYQQSGCTKCSRISSAKKRKLPSEIFINRSQSHPNHNNKNYDYSRVIYINCDTDVTIGCPDHGFFEQTPWRHMNGAGCRKCANIILGNKLRKSTDVYIDEANIQHNNAYDYSKLVYTAGKKDIIIICRKPNHGEFIKIAREHLKGAGCPKCFPSGYSKMSMKWLRQIEKFEGINLLTAESSSGEYKIPGVGRVDGFCSLTNKVYEFHGSFWHGDPELYQRDCVNVINYKTFGELYDKTMNRDNKIRNLGYTLVVMWESEFKKMGCDITIQKKKPKSKT